MYCILVAGIPASGKSTMAEFLAERLGIPALSKDKIKELMYDSIGFQSREEKVRLGIASMNIMYYMAEQMMKCGQPFIPLESFVSGITRRGMDRFVVEGPRIVLDTTDFEKVDMDGLLQDIKRLL